jgi:hypothetical protein
MRVKTPLGLFTGIVVVGLTPAAALGSLLGVSNKDYSPEPAPSPSRAPYSNMGENPTPTTSATPTRRVESVSPTKRESNRVQPTSRKLYSTPHAEVNKVNDEEPVKKVQPVESDEPEGEVRTPKPKDETPVKPDTQPKPVTQSPTPCPDPCKG